MYLLIFSGIFKGSIFGSFGFTSKANIFFIYLYNKLCFKIKYFYNKYSKVGSHWNTNYIISIIYIIIKLYQVRLFHGFWVKWYVIWNCKWEPF